MSNNGELLAAAFTELLGKVVMVVSKEDDRFTGGRACGMISPQDIFNLTYKNLQGASPEASPVATYSSVKKRGTTVTSTVTKHDVIHLVGVEERSVLINTNLHGTVYDFKQDICDQISWLDPEYMRLLFGGKQLEDDKKLTDYNIQNRSTIAVVTRIHGGGGGHWLFDDDLLDPPYDFDFTHIHDDGTVFQRGSYTYKRPCGWNRIALKVKGKYEDDVWLGAAGSRRHSSPGEWAVSYHGTGKLGIKGIAESGYDSSKLRRELYGKGIYSTPDIEVAKGYAQKFGFQGKSYLMVFQNRVNLANSTIIPKERTGAGAEYFVTPLQDNIRPYGICIKEY